MPSLPSAFALALALVSGLVLAPRAPRLADGPYRQDPAPVTVRAAERGAPMVSFADGRALAEPFAGVADPLAMAAGDFDTDGVPDLAVSYETEDGFALAIYRGNVDAIYPNAPEAQARKAAGTFTDAPFLPEPRVASLADRPSHLGAGRFDADTTVDLVVGSGEVLAFLPGDGTGGFGAPHRVDLGGEITAFAVGEVNRRDLREDVVVAVDGPEGARALVFEGEGGASIAEPESFALPARASSLALGPVDGDDWKHDVAIAAGNQLVLVEGRDRARTTAEARVRTRSFEGSITSLALRRVAGAPRPRLVALTSEGDLFELDERLTPERIETGLRPEAHLVCAPATTDASEAVVVADRAARSIRVIAGEAGESTARTDAAFEVEGEPVAVVPMRLNTDVIADLVVIRRGHAAPSTIVSAPRANFEVSTASNAGIGSLRQAILDANMSPGADSISFTNPTPILINPNIDLPAITEAVTIDATTAPGYMGTPRVEIDGNGLNDVLAIVAPNCVVRGFTISRSVNSQIRIQSSNNVVEACYIGTDGTISRGGVFGVFCDGAGSSNTIGGTTAAARNVISGLDFDGILLQGASAGSNTVQGNYIGPDATGLVGIGSSVNGIDIQSPNNTIGGTVNNERNVISANANVGIAFQTASSSSNIISRNIIGAGADTATVMGNANAGVDLFSDAGDNFVGTTDGSAGTVVRYNGSGIVATSSPNNIIQGTTLDSNSGNGLVLMSSGNQIGGSLFTANSIRNNGAAGIVVTGGVNNFLGRNSLFNNAGLAIDLGAAGSTPNDLGDADSGPNNLQNFPVLTQAAVGVSSTKVDFTLNSTPNTTFQIDVYRNPACDGSGFGEAQVYMGAVMVMTNASGNASGFGFFATIPAGQSVTATATDPTGNTSELSACITSVEAADMSAVVDGAPNPVVAGNNLTITATIANGGPGAATNPAFSMNPISDSTFVSIMAPGGWNCTTPSVGGTGPVSCNAPSLAASTDAVFTIVWTVDLDTPDGTAIPLDLSTSSASPDVNLVNNNDIEVVLTTTEADLAITISDSPDPVAAGTDLTYTITAENAGPNDASSATVSIDVPTNTTFVSASAPGGWATSAPPVGATGTVMFTNPLVPAGGVAAFTVTVKVGAGVAAGTMIGAVATVASGVTDPNPGNDIAQATTTVALVSDLGVTKTGAPDPVLPSAEITYTVTVTNAGPSDAANAMLVDPVPAGTGFLSVTEPAGWSCTTPPLLGTGPITCTAPSLPVGASAVFTVVVQVSLGTAAGTVITNTATASSAAADPNGANDAATATTTVEAPPATDVVFEKTSTPGIVAPGGTITYMLTATNDGPASASDVAISDPLPTGVTFVSASSTAGGVLTLPPVGASGTVSCVWAGPTLPGEARGVTIVAQAAPSLPDETVLTNTATATNTVTELDPSNNTSTTTTIVVIDESNPTADLAVTIVEPPEVVETGAQLEYQIIVRNNGPSAAAAVTVSGATPNGTRFVSLSTDRGTVTAPPVGGTGLFAVEIGDLEVAETVELTLTVNVIAEGGVSVLNRVTVTSETNDPQPFNNQSPSFTRVVAGRDALLSWDPPLPCPDDCLNPPLHLQTSTSRARQAPVAAGRLATLVRDPRNTVIGYNIYRSNNPNVSSNPANFFTSVGPTVTSIVVPTAPGGSFFTVTAQYPNGESDDTNAASGGIPEPQITGFEIRGKQVLVFGTGFTDTVTVFVDGIPFTKAAKVKEKNGSIRVVQKGKLLTGQKVNTYLTGQGGVVLVSVLNSDTGIGTFLYRR